MKISYDKNTLRRFGQLTGAVFFSITVFLFLRDRRIASPLAFISGALLAAAYTLPSALKPVYAVWMKAAFILGWINTRVILILLFYLVFTPIGLFMRLMRLDPLEKRIEKGKASYWQEKEKIPFVPSRYEKQF
jgi:hypothetical protein